MGVTVLILEFSLVGRMLILTVFFSYRLRVYSRSFYVLL